MNKKRITSLVAGLALMFGLTAANAESELEGAWIVSSWEDLDGAAIEDAQPGMFIFTGTHYAIMFATTADARPGYDADAGMTDEETLAAYASLTANAGGLEVDGNTFTTYAYIAKDTNYMAGFPENGTEYEFERDGDTLTIKSKTFPQNFTAVLMRVEGAENAPWKTQ
jgi:hypothetical protein